MAFATIHMCGRWNQSNRALFWRNCVACLLLSFTNGRRRPLTDNVSVPPLLSQFSAASLVCQPRIRMNLRVSASQILSCRIPLTLLKITFFFGSIDCFFTASPFSFATFPIPFPFFTTVVSTWSSSLNAPVFFSALLRRGTSGQNPSSPSLKSGSSTRNRSSFVGLPRLTSVEGEGIPRFRGGIISGEYRRSLFERASRAGRFGDPTRFPENNRKAIWLPTSARNKNDSTFNSSQYFSCWNAQKTRMSCFLWSMPVIYVFLWNISKWNSVK